MSNRPSLSSLGPRLARKTAAPERQQAGASEGDAPRRDPRVSVIVRMAAAQRKTLRGIALHQDTTVQALIEQAVQDLIARHSK
jgi:hypothetical protein